MGNIARAIRNSAYTLTQSVWTAIPFTSAPDEAGNLSWDVGTPTRITCSADGRYTFMASQYILRDTVGARFVKNGSDVLAEAWAARCGIATAPSLTCWPILSSGDYVELYLYSDNVSRKIDRGYVGAAFYGDGPTEKVGCRVTRATDQSFTAGAFEAVSFSTEVFDYGGYFDIGSPTRLTVPAGKGGVHIVTCDTSEMTNLAVDGLTAVLGLNGALQLWIVPQDDPTQSAAHLFGTPIDLSAGDYLELFVRLDNATNSIVARDNSPSFSIIRAEEFGA